MPFIISMLDYFITYKCLYFGNMFWKMIDTSNKITFIVYESDEMYTNIL